ncbi:MAG: aldehyde dehydrogenase family protein, partial [Tepidisphaeraceae bacterium]
MSFDTQHPALLIGDRWISSGRFADVVDPFHRRSFAQVPLADERMIDAAIGAAEAAFAGTRSSPAHARAKVLENIARGIE